MKTIKQQRGMATLLLVLLVGISIMLITAGLAKVLMSKKEASVAVQAQTNAQLMGWAGVGAFRAYLKDLGKDNLNQIRALHGQDVVLKQEGTQAQIVAKNIQVSGCTSKDVPCIITIELSANNNRAQAATTIQAVYDLSLLEDGVSKAGETSVLNFTRDTLMSGTTLSAEEPKSKVVINVDGTASIQAGFRTNNIEELTINATGDVIMDCFTTKCGNTKININSEGNVHIANPGNFGDIYAKGWVKLITGVKADNIYSVKDVHLSLNSSAKVIHAADDVYITEGSSADLIHSKDDVILSTAAKANHIYAQGKIELYLGSYVSGNLEAGQYINISGSTVMGDAKAYQYIALDTFSKLHGSAYAKGMANVGLLIQGVVRLSTSWIGGNVYANGDVVILDPNLLGLFGNEDIRGDIFITGRVKPSDYSIKGAKNTNLRLDQIPELNFSVPNIVDTARIRQHIDEKMGFYTRVDVRKYKDQANYIFTQDGKAARVFLNYLRNEQTGITYMYENGKQYAIDAQNKKTLVNSTGFYLGKYTVPSANWSLFNPTREYVGAICEKIDFEHLDVKSGKCTSSIIGYLPRASVETRLDVNLLNIIKIFGIPEDYNHVYDVLSDVIGTPSVHIWYVRSISAESSFANATLAPGIMYFEGAVSMAGEPNWNADSSSNVFTNTFLAEGSIDAIALSPKIYSPYNVIREGNADIICNRSVKTKNGAALPTTTPATLSKRYLTPVNLCKNDNEFRYDMNRDAAGEKIKIEIDNKIVDKLDLGYVALMSNKIIRIGACAQIYGDVFARSNIEASALCGLGANPNVINGSIGTQGEAPYIKGIHQANVFLAGSKLVVPSSKYTNIRNTAPTHSPGTLSVEKSVLQWARYQ